MEGWLILVCLDLVAQTLTLEEPDMLPYVPLERLNMTNQNQRDVCP